MLTPRSQFSQTLILLYTTLYDMSRSGGVFTRFYTNEYPLPLLPDTFFPRKRVFMLPLYPNVPPHLSINLYHFRHKL